MTGQAMQPSGAQPHDRGRTPTISVELATRLRDAGLAWQPTNGDEFFIPDRNLDDEVFAINDMSVEVRAVPGGRLIAFNGAVEWALDSIMQREVVWLPNETQLRALLGDDFVALHRVDGGYRCEASVAGELLAFGDRNAIDAYGLALLEKLRRGS